MCEDGFFCFNSRDSGMQSIEIKNMDTFRKEIDGGIRLDPCLLAHFPELTIAEG